jgi:uncharacterized protein YbaP (TraB family)
MVDLVKQNGNSISGIESASDYIGLMNKIQEGHEAEIYDAAMNKNTQAIKLQLYKKMDIRGLASIKQAEPGFKDMANEYFFYRNKRLAAALKPKINAKSVFIMIDAASIGGENGLLYALLQEGFSIEPVVK